MHIVSRISEAGYAAALSILAIVALGAACSQRDDGVRPTDDAAMTQPIKFSLSGDPAVRDLDRRNPQAWVGRAHNAALDEFHRELRKPGLIAKDLCSYMINFVSDPERLKRNGAPVKAIDVKASARAGLAASRLCDVSPGVRQATTSAPYASLLRQDDLVLSKSAQQLLLNSQYAAENALDPSDLASRLSPLLAASSELSAVEQEIVAATISVAQYSFEYWQSNLEPFQRDFWVDYNDCALRHRSNGYDSETARSLCIVGTVAPTAAPNAPAGRHFFVAASPLRTCGLGANYKKLAGADVVGGITGGVRGLKALGGGGAAVGAASGAAIGSLAQFLKSTWDMFWCAM